MDVQTLLMQTELRDLAEEAGAQFGRGHSSRCPLHPGSDNPTAFRLYRGRDGRWRWHCFTRCPPDANDGDAIAFYMRWRGVDFLTAVHELMERSVFDGGASRPRRADAQAPDPDPVASERWQARARQFLAYAQACLWSPEGQAAAGYLLWERGLSDRTVALWGLGYNPEDAWEDPAEWGLDRVGESEDGEEPRPVWLPRGIVIPAWGGLTLRYVKVRRPLPGDALARHIDPVDRLPDVKYANLRGGRSGLFGANSLRGLPAVLFAEGEFDALLAWQAAGDLVDVATLGSASRRPDRSVFRALRRARRILVAYDDDAAGAAGKARWQKASRRARLVDPPRTSDGGPAKDITAYWQAGGDVRGWIRGLVTPVFGNAHQIAIPLDHTPSAVL